MLFIRHVFSLLQPLFNIPPQLSQLLFLALNHHLHLLTLECALLLDLVYPFLHISKLTR